MTGLENLKFCQAVEVDARGGDLNNHRAGRPIGHICPTGRIPERVVLLEHETTARPTQRSSVPRDADIQDGKAALDPASCEISEADKTRL